MSRVAVLIPVYNAPQSLERTLKSLDIQPGSFDICVIDDGSDAHLSPSKTAYRRDVHWLALSHNQGVVAARNEGLRFVFDQGYDYVALQDAGDVDADGRMEAQASFLDEHPCVAVVGGWAQYVDVEGRALYVDRLPAETGQIRQHMRYVCAFCNPACMFRVEALKALSLYDSRFPIASDYELLFRMSYAFPVANLQKILVIKEENPNSISLSRRRMAIYYRMKVQAKYFGFRCIHSYLGLLYNLMLLGIPYPILLRLKRLYKRLN